MLLGWSDRGLLYQEDKVLCRISLPLLGGLMTMMLKDKAVNWMKLHRHSTATPSQ